MTELKHFQAIKYTTSSGENCVATKNNGIVTIEGDKNGVRQMKQDEFMKQFVEDQSKKTLERTPAKDTVSFSGISKITNSISPDVSKVNNFWEKLAMKNHMANKVEKQADEILPAADDWNRMSDDTMNWFEETPIKKNDYIDDWNRMADDLEKEAKKRREQERIDNENMMMGAICLDDALRTSQRNIGEITDDLSHNFGKLDDFSTPHSTDYFDNTNDILSSHSSILDDTNDFLPHNSFDDFGSSCGSSFDNLGDDMMGGMW